MDFVSNQHAQIKEMLAAIGIESIETLFSSIPNSLKLPSPSQDDGMSESEGIQLLESIGNQNTYPQMTSYLGGGAYEHYIPALVSAITGRQEFFTSYTPYQPEVSQGMLQAIFEFQSAICALTGMDASNASVYDGASACAESLLMCLRSQKKTKVLVAENIHPHYQDVIHQYIDQKNWSVETIRMGPEGTLDSSSFQGLLDENTAGVLLQSPNFFGIIEDLKPIIQQIHDKKAYVVLAANPLSYGIFPSAKELRADIAVGDTQPFGLPLHFGGPYAGYIACRQELIRQLPGRIVGETVDTQGKRGFVLTLQAREQHIRREKATSNICTNQSLAALASLVTILWYGKEGLRKLALTNYQRSAYLKERLAAIPGVKLLTNKTSFNEFAVHFGKPAAFVKEQFRKHAIEPGLSLKEYYPSLYYPSWKDYFLIAVTETKSKEQLDRYLAIAEELA